LPEISIVCFFLVLVVIHHRLLHQLDIKNFFLHGDLEEEIHMEQPPGFVAQGESDLVCKLYWSLWLDAITSSLVW